MSEPQQQKPNHRSVLVLCVALLAIATGGVIYSPTLYQLFCAATGYNGTVQRATAATPAERASTGRTFKISFDSNVAGGLDWEFRPEQSSVEVEIGEPTTITYYAKNRSDEPVVAHAVFNVTPFQVAPYFFKIECFCFIDEKLGPGESAEMPVVFYLDKQILEDKEAMALRRATLSYTFYEQGDEPGRLEAARDLKAGSEEKAEAIATGSVAAFDNDAPRD
jgi:cytochrome c oxidase assembly protein subunit 11